MCEVRENYEVLVDSTRAGSTVLFPAFPELSSSLLSASNTDDDFSVTFLINGNVVKLNRTTDAQVALGNYLFQVQNVSTRLTNDGSLVSYIQFSICRVTASEGCVFTDEMARDVEALWKEAFPDATLLPGIGLPSQSNGVMTLTHTDGSGNLLKINGLSSRSPLSNNALFSSECSEGKFINLYEIMLPDTPGSQGQESSSQFYVRKLAEQGLSVAGVHFHWWGTGGVAAIHHQMTTEMAPMEFSRRTIAALQETMRYM